MFESALTLLKDVIIVIGGAIGLWGVVKLGLGLKDHAGNDMASSFAWIAGGAVIVAASRLVNLIGAGTSLFG